MDEIEVGDEVTSRELPGVWTVTAIYELVIRVNQGERQHFRPISEFKLWAKAQK